MNKLTILLVTLLAVTPVFIAGFVPADEIIDLPGWEGPLPSRIFSGYLNISATKHMHYVFVEAEENLATAPVVIFLNGGPGCSSMYSYLDETGPFHFDANNASKLVKFEQSWTRLANMLYLESPVGVGFSYSDDSSDYITNDDKAASDNYLAVNEFFRLFPEFQKRKFFITGESYAGIYVPTLAEEIINNSGKKSHIPPLTGIAVGNGCTGTEIGVCGNQGDQFQTEYLLGQAFAPPELKDQIRSACDWKATRISTKCENLIAEFHRVIGNVNLYDIYGSCISGSDRENDGLSNLFAPLNRNLGGPNPCIDSIKESKYMNSHDVIDAFHVVTPPFRWGVCGNQIQYTSTRKNLPRDTYPALIKNMRVLIYNGDWDCCVPYTDNYAWTEGMGIKAEAPWHPWTYDEGQVGGYATRYTSNFTFITVRGGRHEVPETAPFQAFEMLRRFLVGEEF